MAYEITIPSAILPLPIGKNIDFSPKDEKDVKIDSVTKKNNRRKPLEIIASNQRGPHREPEIPAQLQQQFNNNEFNYDYEEDLRRASIPTTGVKYRGKFELPENDRAPAEDTTFGIPEERKMYFLPGRDTIISKSIRPEEDEIEAARNGQRWHWALEHRFMPPGSKFNETVWNGVDRENAWLKTLLAGQAKQRLEEKTQPVTKPLASERMRATFNNNWNKFIEGLKQGHYSSMDQIPADKLQWADDFKKMYEQTFGEGSSASLTPIPSVLGKRSDLMKKQNFDLRSSLIDTEDAMDNIYKWSKDGSWQDPMKSQMIKNYLDKISQALSAELGGDSKSMADAEKIRIQILYLPEESMNMVKEEIANYRDFLSSVMDYGRQKGWSQNIIGKINRGKEGLDQALLANGKGNISTLVGYATSTIGDIVPSLTPAEREHAINIDAVLNAGIEAHENYMKNMVLAADVDPALVYQFAELLHNRLAKRYNDEMENAERPERARETAKYDIDMSALSRSVKPSEFLKPIDYKNLIVEYSRPESAGGNPQANIEQKTGSKVTMPSKKRNTVTNITEGDLL